MNDVFTYLHWRGDLSFDAAPFNEIDNLIMSRLSYLPLDMIVTEKIKLTDAFNKLLSVSSTVHYYNESDKKIVKELIKCRRYNNLYLSDFVNKIDYNKEQQFAALTIILPNNIKYISYRGTDNTLVGFKEDFNMSFMDKLPSQELSKEYINKESSDAKLIVGGHSKGGNLAIYASIYCNSSIQDRIISIYNNDGPGFLKEITETENYKKIESRIKTFIPGSSVVGRLLNTSGKHKVVKSNNTLIYQHDLYSWEVDVNHFVYLKDTASDSKYTESLVNDWVNKLSYDERKKFADTIYNVIVESNLSTVDDLHKNLFKNIKNIVDNYKKVNDNDKKVINKVINYFFETFKESLFEDK